MKIIEINIFRQLRLLLYIFIFFNLLNVAGILIFRTSWSELYSQLGFVVLLTLICWLFFLFVKIVYRFIRKRNEPRISI
ncbi:MAG: hypothetical protein ACK5JD_04455 [Mangrovibacterium sp.]